MQKLTKSLFTLALPVAAVAGAVWMWGMPGAQTDAFSYETGAATRGSILKTVSTSGPVRALVTVSVGSQLSGNIRELKVDYNTEVKAGDVLAVLDDKTYVSRVEQSKADLAMAKANLGNQQAAMDKAEAVLKLAERGMERQQTLAKRGVASSASLDTATRDVEVAKAELAVMKAQIESARAQIAQREAGLRQAQIDLDRTQIRSPINGTVISRTIDIGQTVAASLQAPELFKIAQDLRRIRIEAQVNEADVGAVTEGNDVAFTVDAYPDRQFRGRVTQVRLAATELNNVVTYTVIIEADNDDRKLFPGMTANAVVESARKDNVLRIVSDALRFKPREGMVDQEAQASQRRQQMVERVGRQLSLSDQQVAQVSAELDKVLSEMRAQRSDTPRPPSGFGSAPQRTSGGGGEAARGRIGARMEQIVAGVITDAQRPAFEAWKAQRESRGSSRASAGRSATVWVLGADNDLSSRTIRIGVADDQYTEVLGSALKEGEKVVVRTRKVIAK